MNIDDPKEIKQNDVQGMLQHIVGLPDQLLTAWEDGRRMDPGEGKSLERIIIAGMGGSAIGADLIEAYLRPYCPLPVVVHRDYGLPAWATDPGTLVITSSHSGNTEETLSAFDAAVEQGCRRMVICTGGRLLEKALEHQTPVMQFVHDGQPRAAVGFSFGLLLAAFTNLGLIPDQSEKVHGAVDRMKLNMKQLVPEAAVRDNPAKRLAGQVLGRMPVVVGAGLMAPVARRWKGQFNELAKSWAQFDYLPEFDHNSLAGLEVPENILKGMIVLFLKAPADRAENQLRVDLTRRVMMTEGVNTDIIQVSGETDLEQLWSAVHLGDFCAYYLACLGNTDPTPIPAISTLKAEMQHSRQS